MVILQVQHHGNQGKICLFYFPESSSCSPRENINFSVEEINERIPNLSNYGQEDIDRILLRANTEVGLTSDTPHQPSFKILQYNVNEQHTLRTPPNLPLLPPVDIDLQSLRPISFLNAAEQNIEHLQQLYQRFVWCH